VTTEGSDEDNGRMAVGVTVKLWSRGGNEREIEGSNIEIGFGLGVTVGSERPGGVLELYPSSPTSQIPALQYPRTPTFIRRDKIHSRLRTRPLARAAKIRGEMIALENIIFEKKSCEE